jgi:predicted N-acetyltransferase YhbS
MNWNLVEEDFKFTMKLEPGGCFVLFYNSERVGIVTNISFGRLGWLGNLIVSENYRKKGAGTLLVRHSVNYLKNKNTETVGLYAYIDKVPFYKRLGFSCDSDFIVLKGKGFSSPDEEVGIREARKEDIHEIVEYDHSCFGASRKKLLEPILLNPDNLCCVAIEDGGMLGYAVAKVYEEMAEIGPLICRQEHSNIAVNLLKAILKRLERVEVTLCVPKRESAIFDFLIGHGFSESFRVARMFFGPLPSVKNCIYVAESLERG